MVANTLQTLHMAQLETSLSVSSSSFRFDSETGPGGSPCGALLAAPGLQVGSGVLAEGVAHGVAGGPGVDLQALS